MRTAVGILLIFFLLGASFALPTTSAQETDSCDISSSPTTANVTQEPEINITARNGPPYHDYYDVFNTNGTLLIISVRNPSENEAHISVEITGKLLEDVSNMEIDDAPNPPRPVEGPYSESLETQEINTETKCIYRLGPGESYPVAFEISANNVVLLSNDSDNVEEVISTRKNSVSGTIRINSSYPTNSEILTNSRTVDVRTNVLVLEEEPNPASGGRIILPLPSSDTALLVVQILVTILTLYLAYVQIKLSIFPNKDQEFREKYQSATSLSIVSFRNTLVWVRYRLLNTIRWFIEPLYLFVVNRLDNYHEEYGIGESPALPPPDKAEDRNQED